MIASFESRLQELEKLVTIHTFKQDMIKYDDYRQEIAKLRRITVNKAGKNSRWAKTYRRRQVDISISFLQLQTHKALFHLGFCLQVVQNSFEFQYLDFDLS